MDDYDWQVEGLDWTDWSHHEDTEVVKAVAWDANLSFVPRRWGGAWTWRWMFGYRREEWKWEARGGTYVYSVDGFRDTTGAFPDGRVVITYEQVYNTPYVGVEISREENGFSLRARIAGSFCVWAEAIDQHHLRDLVTYDRFAWGGMISCRFEGGYSFREDLFLLVRFSYTLYGTMRGDSEWHYNDVGVVETYADLAGADLHAYRFSLVFGGRF